MFKQTPIWEAIVSAGLAAGQCSMVILTICLQVLLYVVSLLSINATHAPKSMNYTSSRVCAILEPSEESHLPYC
jgi:protoporphyrinogen oxidase